MRIAAPLAAVLALGLAAVASAATPASYRAQVNRICSGYTPTVKKLSSQLSAASKTGNGQAYGMALGKLLVIQLDEDRRVEAVSVPTALRAQMAPILQRLKTIDGHARKALDAALAGSSSTLVAELKTIQTLAKPLNGMLDAAGLRECGSKQS